MRLIHVLALAIAILTGAAVAAQDGPASIGDPTLRLSTSLARVPKPLDPGPATSAEPSFTERTHQPVQVLRQDSERRERELLDALATAKRHHEATVDIERRLAEARGQRYANPVVYTLAALLAAAVVGALLLWRRSGAMSRARRRSVAAPDAAATR